jgi:hypothetical protein
MLGDDGRYDFAPWAGGVFYVDPAHAVPDGFADVIKVVFDDEGRTGGEAGVAEVVVAGGGVAAYFVVDFEAVGMERFFAFAFGVFRDDAVLLPLGEVDLVSASEANATTCR